MFNLDDHKYFVCIYTVPLISTVPPNRTITLAGSNPCSLYSLVSVCNIYVSHIHVVYNKLKTGRSNSTSMPGTNGHQALAVLEPSSWESTRRGMFCTFVILRNIVVQRRVEKRCRKNQDELKNSNNNTLHLTEGTKWFLFLTQTISAKPATNLMETSPPLSGVVHRFTRPNSGIPDP